MRGAAALLGLWLAAAPAWSAGPPPLPPIPVVTTSTDLRALVEAVGGERVRVESLASPLHDPHAIDVKPGALTRLREASLLVRIGLDHEPWLAPLLRSLGDPRFVRGSLHDLDMSKGVPLLQTETPRVQGPRAHVHGFGNTHYWLDPENARLMTAAILERLARLAPDDRGRFEAARQAFLGRLDAGLVRWREAMAPHRGARVVVVHETWPYFAERFGLRVVAAVEPIPGVPPSASSLATLTRRMKEASVRVLIADPSSNPSVVSQVAARTRARAVTLIPSVGGDPEAPDYLALFDLNVRRLAEALSAAR